jgi:hypothetical protein
VSAAGPPAPAGPAPQRPGRGRRRALGLALAVGLGLVDLLLAAWLLRGLWLTPWLTPTAATALGELLGAEVRIGGIGGSLLRDLRIEGLTITGTSASSPLVAVENARIELGFALGPLLDGDPTGVRGLRLHAERVELRLPPAVPQEAGTASGPAADPWRIGAALIDGLGLLSDGATLRIDDLVLRGPDGRTLAGRGPARITCTPRPRRRVVVEWAGVLRAEVGLTADGLFRGEVEVEDLPARLTALGVDQPFVGGTARIGTAGDLGDRELAATITWRGEMRERGGSALDAALRIRGDWAQVDLDGQGPGGRILAQDLGLPLGDIDDLLHAARGSVEVQIRDLEPWRPLLPEVIAARLPIRADLRARLDEQGLTLRRGTIAARGLRATLLGGRLPLAEGTGKTAARASLRMRIEAIEPLVLPIDGEEVRLLGRAEVEAAGSLGALELRGNVALAAGSAYGHSWSTLRADATYAGGTIEVRDLEVLGLRESSSAGRAELRGAVTVGLGTEDRPGTRLAVEVRARGEPSAWLDALAPRLDPQRRLRALALSAAGEAAFESGRWPTGHLALEIDALELAGEPQLSAGRVELEVRRTADGTSRGPRFELAMDAGLAPGLLPLVAPDADLPSLDDLARLRTRITGTLGDDEVRDLFATLSATGLRLAGGEALDLTAAVAMPAPDVLRVDQLTVCGAVELEAAGVLPLAGDEARFDFGLRGRVDDAAALAAWLPALRADGRLAIDLRLSGSRSAPDADLVLDAHLSEVAGLARALWREDLGPVPDGPLDLDATLGLRGGILEVDELRIAGGTPAEGLHLDARGTVPLRFAADRTVAAEGRIRGFLEIHSDRRGGGAWRLGSPLTWSAEAISFDHLLLEAPLAQLDGHLAVLAPARLLDGTPPGALEVRGTCEVESLDLAALPAALTVDEILAGLVDVLLVVDGTLAAPDLDGTVAVHGGRLKLAADVPTIDEVEVRIAVTPRDLQIETFTARVGVGTVAVTGGLSAPDGSTLLAAIGEARVDLAVTAREALLIRSTGRKARADADLQIRGDAHRLAVTGTVEIDSAKYVKRISLVPDLTTRGGAAVGGGMTLFEIPGPLGDALQFDVLLRSRDEVEVVTNVFNAPLALSLTLRGSGSRPHLEGAVSATSGTLRLPAISLAVSQFLVTFSADDPLHPVLLLRASTRRHGIDVTLTATGRIDAPEILMSSLPPLTQQELFVLVSTGVLPDTLQRQGIGGRATMVGGYFAQEILDFYFGSDSTESGESFVDRFEFHSGREISRNGVESIVVDFDLDGGFVLEGERDVYEDYNMGILYRIRF